MPPDRVFLALAMAISTTPATAAQGLVGPNFKDFSLVHRRSTSRAQLSTDSPVVHEFCTASSTAVDVGERVRSERRDEPGALVDGPLPPHEAPKRMTLPKSFKATLFAGEPDLVQPIAFTFDEAERHRRWSRRL